MYSSALPTTPHPLRFFYAVALAAVDFEAIAGSLLQHE